MFEHQVGELAPGDRRRPPALGRSAAAIVELEVLADQGDVAGADGIVNAVCFNCMMGNASAAIVEKIRRDYHDIPIITAVYAGGEDPSRRMVLDAFVSQVKDHHRRRELDMRAA